MTELSGPAGEPIIAHYNDPENLDKVGDRFEVYRYARPRVDIHEEQINVLDSLSMLASEGTRSRVVCDVGSAKGDMYKRLLRRSFDGTYIGIDRSANQFRLSKDKVLFLAANAILVNASADQLPIADQSVDIALDNFVLYHQTKQERQNTYAELKRIVRENGVIGFATSGFLNKATQRQHERHVADLLGIEPPPEMNTNWTSERAEEEIATNFADWHKYDFVHHGYFIITSEKEADVSINSIRTGRDQYNPVPDEESFGSALAEVRADLMQRIQDGYPAVDNIDRTFYIVSRHELDLPARTVLT